MRSPKTLAKLLLKLYNGDKSRWTQFTRARLNVITTGVEPQGDVCEPTDAQATCWCLMGALETVNASYEEVRDFSRRFKHGRIIGFNDKTGRKFWEITRKLRSIK